MINKTIHTLFGFSFTILVDAKTRPPSSAASLPLVVPCQGIAARKLAATLGACMRPLTSVKLCMAFQVMQSAKPRLTCRAFVRFLLAVSKKVTFQVMMAREVG